MGQVVITYETLFEILRREKSRGELQKLDEDFLQHLTEYLAQKKSIRSLNEEDRQRNEKQLYNVKKLVRELYERREKKIVEMALNKSRTQSQLIDESALLADEKALYEHLITQFDRSRAEVLYKTLQGEAPKKSSKIKVRFIQETEPFVGEDLQIYGPYTKEQEDAFSEALANVLVNKGCAEIIKE